MRSLVLTAVLEAIDRLPAGVIEELAREVLRVGSPERADRLVAAVAHSDARRVAEAIAIAWRSEPAVSAAELAAMLRASAAARSAEELEGRVEVVMTGPSERDAPTRATEAVVIDVVSEAKRELVLMTYAAMSYGPLRSALEAACDRGVRMQVVVETVAGAKGLLSTEPSKAFAGIAGLHLFHWPTDRRPGPVPGRLHAKLVVADRKVAFVTSANLTGSALEHNLECGLLVRGGPAPRRLADHVGALIREGVLQPLTPGIEKTVAGP
jgi:phosphatidylserine/phosphatidylglycerophosphate/cardiolipin synthase-like enzyme